MEINANTRISELLQKCPDARAVLERHNMSCIGCLGIKEETLKKGALMHGLDVEAFLKELQLLAK